MKRRQALTTVGLVALLLIDIALVALAFRNPFRSEPERSSSVGITASTAASASATTATGGRPSTHPAEAGTSMTLVPIDSSRAWRFSSGSCRDGGATLAFTTNGGATWTPVESPFAAITRLQSTDPDRVLIVGAHADCRVATLRSTDAGITWTSAGPVQVWFRTPDQVAEVTNSNGRPSTPCGASGSVSSLVALSAGAALALCADGKAVETADAGASWVETARGFAPLAIDAHVVAGRLAPTLAGLSDNCAGLAITTIASGGSSRVGCADVGVALGPQQRGRISLSSAGDAWWLAVGTDTFTSTDAGKTWSRP
ncbi:MAG: hypothetical protein IPF90_00895 [Actinomycetales bacterium]|nr:hypothetical protein [Candidatus Phosphoribacter baldrii]